MSIVLLEIGNSCVALRLTVCHLRMESTRTDGRDHVAQHGSNHYISRCDDTQYNTTGCRRCLPCRTRYRSNPDEKSLIQVHTHAHVCTHKRTRTDIGKGNFSQYHGITHDLKHSSGFDVGQLTKSNHARNLDKSSFQHPHSTVYFVPT